MNRKLIHLGPLALIIAGVFWSNHINPGATMGYNLGFGFGMFLVPAIPGLIIALIHRSMSKKKADESVGVDVIDSPNEPVMKKKSFLFYFSLYTTILGALMFIAVMNSKRD